MPRVLATYRLCGAIEGFCGGHELLLTLAVLEGGRVVGSATAANDEDEMVVAVEGGCANLDLYESTDVNHVFSCRFTLLEIGGEGDDAMAIDCAARVSSASGLVGRWNDEGTLGKKGVYDRPFRMAVRDVKTEPKEEKKREEKGEDGESLVAGTYVLTGTATSQSGVAYDSRVTLELCEDGTLRGRSDELSIAPQVCLVSGFWDASGKSICYTMSYTNGCTATYHYAGKMISNEFVGRWANTTIPVVSSGERGDFLYRLIAPNGPARSADFGAQTECEDTITEGSDSGAHELCKGEYRWEGVATSDTSVSYFTVVECTLLENGRLVGKSHEGSVEPQVCDIEGTWKPECIRFKLQYVVDNIVSYYTYVGRLTVDQATGARKLVGRWRNSAKKIAKSNPSEVGAFAFAEKNATQ